MKKYIITISEDLPPPVHHCHYLNRPSLCPHPPLIGSVSAALSHRPSPLAPKNSPSGRSTGCPGAKRLSSRITDRSTRSSSAAAGSSSSG